LYNSVERIANR